MSTWKQTTEGLYKAVLLYTIGGIASSVFAYLGGLGKTASGINALMGNGGGSSFGIWDILGIVAAVAIIYGYWKFFTGLKDFKEQVNPADAPYIQKISTCTIIMMVATVLAVIPVVGLLGGIANLVAWIILLLAYNSLKKSVTFPATAREGASKLFLAMILDIVGAVVGIIPLIGGITNAILAIIAFIFVLQGWKAIFLSEEPAA